MKKLILVSAVLVGAASASLAGVLPGPGLHIKLPFLPEIAVRAPAPVIPTPPVVVAPRAIYDAPREFMVAPAVVCPPAPVVRVPVAPLCPPAPVMHVDPRGWDGHPDRDFRGRDHGRPERDFRHDDRGWEHGPEGHHGR
jgi:hypothetical protein